MNISTCNNRYKKIIFIYFFTSTINGNQCENYILNIL